MIKPPDARKDFLTSCYLRDGLQPFLNLLEERFAVSKKPFSVLIMDVDHFKHFNDKFGHLNGDEVLKYFSSSLRLDLEDEENAPFRFGGDEFVVVFPDKSAHEAAKLAARLKKNIKTRSCLIRGRQLTVTFSGGIACYPADARSLEQLLERADQALYYSKNHGRAQVTCFHEVKYKSSLKLLFIVAVAVLGLSALNLVDIDWMAPVKTARELLAQYMPAKNGTPPPQPAPEPSEPKTLRDTIDPGNAPPEPEPPDETTETGEPAPADPAVSTAPAAGSHVRLLMKNNRKLEGTLVEETDDDVAIEIGFQTGKAMMRFKRSQIDRIEKI